MINVLPVRPKCILTVKVIIASSSQNNSLQQVIVVRIRYSQSVRRPNTLVHISLPNMPARRAIRFACVFCFTLVVQILHKQSRNILSITKLSGLVYVWEGLINQSFVFFQSLKGRCHDNHLKAKLVNVSDTAIIRLTGVVLKQIAGS